jgi:excisionase family DNA binding protein
MGADLDLLDIAQAAALLRVSEASLRRWTNRGLLPCLRIGGRRERRFRRADLMAFVEGRSAAASIGHRCGLYTSDAGRTRQAARLLGEALTDGSTCVLAAAPDVRVRVVAQLARRRPSVQRAIDAERLVLTDYADTTAKHLAYWKACFETATRKGATSIRVVGDVSGSLVAGGKDFAAALEYEAAYESASRRFPVATVCLYDARRHSGLETAAILAIHPDLLRPPITPLVS